MIKYALCCEAGHGFEGWFGSSDDYDAQAERRQVGCPVCGSVEVRKQIMAPALAGVRRDAQAEAASAHARIMQMMSAVRRHVHDTFEPVGDRFADEARAIHEGRSEARGIYGEATPGEVRELLADGVPVAPLPPEPPKKTELN